MIRFRLRWPALLMLCTVLTACQTTQTRPEQLPTSMQGYQPALDSDEAGLWMIMDKAEQDLKTSGSLIEDSRANAYLREIVCRLVAEICADFRVYLVSMPNFNASMAPNGVMQVWTGLLLRTENEAQLAFVLGHEISHYRYQHSLQMFRQAKDATGILAPFQVVTAAAGIGYVGSLAQIATLGSLLKYSRDHEREADAGGFELLVNAGYNPSEAARVWEMLLEEKAALDEDAPSIFLSTHPPSEERVQNLKDRAASVQPPAHGWVTGTERYASVMDPLRHQFMRQELQLRQFPATQVLIDRMKASGYRLADTWFYQGELYRTRAEEGDLDKAEKAYLESARLDGAPAGAFRELGIIYMKSDRGAQARSMFEAYLEHQPDAFDSSMVKSWLRKIDEGES